MYRLRHDRKRKKARDLIFHFSPLHIMYSFFSLSFLCIKSILATTGREDFFAMLGWRHKRAPQVRRAFLPSFSRGRRFASSNTFGVIAKTYTFGCPRSSPEVTLWYFYLVILSPLSLPLFHSPFLSLSFSLIEVARITCPMSKFQFFPEGEGWITDILFYCAPFMKQTDNKVRTKDDFRSLQPFSSGHNRLRVVRNGVGAIRNVYSSLSRSCNCIHLTVILHNCKWFS